MRLIRQRRFVSSLANTVQVLRAELQRLYHHLPSNAPPTLNRQPDCCVNDEERQPGTPRALVDRSQDMAKPDQGGSQRLGFGDRVGGRSTRFVTPSARSGTRDTPGGKKRSPELIKTLERNVEANNAKTSGHMKDGIGSKRSSVLVGLPLDERTTYLPPRWSKRPASSTTSRAVGQHLSLPPAPASAESTHLPTGRRAVPRLPFPPLLEGIGTSASGGRWVV